jgi:glycosyltransferase involved in cell wall biosynthesis
MATIGIDARILGSSTGRYVHRLLDALQDLGSPHAFVVLVRAVDRARWAPAAVNFEVQVADHAPFTIGEQTGFLRQLNKLDLDLVHFPVQHQPVLYRRPYVTTIHDLTLLRVVNRRPLPPLQSFYKHRVKPVVFRHALARIAHRATLVLTPTEHVRADVLRQFGLPQDRVVATHEAADGLPGTHRPVEDLVGRPFLLSVGNAFPYKNLRRLIDAFAELGVPGLRLALAGKPDVFTDDLAAHVREQRTDGVVFLGRVSDEELAWLYANARVYVFPSLMEGFGLPGLEAMSFGTPVAASSASCLPEVYADGALYFDPEDTAEMTRVLRRLLEDPSLSAEVAQRGRTRAQSFSWARTAAQTHDVYDAALAARR